MPTGRRRRRRRKWMRRARQRRRGRSPRLGGLQPRRRWRPLRRPPADCSSQRLRRHRRDCGWCGWRVEVRVMQEHVDTDCISPGQRAVAVCPGGPVEPRPPTARCDCDVPSAWKAPATECWRLGTRCTDYANLPPTLSIAPNVSPGCALPSTSRQLPDTGARLSTGVHICWP